MEILMLRLDVYEKQHDKLLRFWKEIIHAFDTSDVNFFTLSFVNWSESLAPQIFPKMYILSESYFNLQSTLNDLGAAEREIKEKLKMPKLLDILKARIELARGTSDLKPEKNRLLEEYSEIQDSKKLLDRDMENLAKVILKERQKLWNHIDTLIIHSYKQLLYDISGSHEFAEAFMKEMIRHPPVKAIEYGRRNHDYELLIEICYQLDGCIGDWISDIEHLVGASQ